MYIGPQEKIAEKRIDFNPIICLYFIIIKSLRTFFMIIALIMAGGRGTRMNSTQEKPLIEIKGKSLILRVVKALEEAGDVERIVVATSPNTPQTALFMNKLGFKVLKTPGEGYVEDLAFLASRDEFKDQILLTVTSDLPLITGEIIDGVLEEYQKSSKTAMSVMIPVDLFREHGLEPSLVLGNLVPSGLNILRGKDNEQDEEVLILNKIELALNINSPEDIISLEKLGGNLDR
jgi:adenosylcobinamide-phosphate guanylyltransferase